MKITQEQLNQLDYMDLMIKTQKSDKQKYVIEMKRLQKVIEARNRFTETVNSKPFERKIYLNHLPWSFKNKWIKVEDITNEMVENEISLWSELWKYLT